MTANHVQHRQRQQTYRRRKKDAQRAVREFERRETAEATAVAWAHRYWEDSANWVRFLPSVVDSVPITRLDPSQVPVVEGLYAEVRPGDDAGRWPT